MGMTTAAADTGAAGARKVASALDVAPAMDPIGRALGELPVLTPVRAEHVLLAVRAVVVHGPQEWPAGVVCRNDRAPHPCRLARWGRRVLVAAGIAEDRIDSLIAKGDPYASPWS